MAIPIEPSRQRNLCLRCLRAITFCYCSDIKPIQARFRLVILQHPLERKKTVGTARMAHLCVSNSSLIGGIRFEQDDRVNQIIADPANHCVVLFPGPQSLHLTSENHETLGGRLAPHQTLVVFVIDGTWIHAKRMLRLSPNLSALPQISFTPGKTSEYRFRREPHPHCLSTVEAIHRLIEILDPKSNPSNLLDVFRKMVERQVVFSEA